MDEGWTPERIKKAREQAKLSQRALGDKVGASASAVSQWESGDTSPTYSHRKMLDQVLSGNSSPSDRERIATLEREVSSLRDLLAAQGREIERLLPAVARLGAHEALQPDTESQASRAVGSVPRRTRRSGRPSA